MAHTRAGSSSGHIPARVPLSGHQSHTTSTACQNGTISAAFTPRRRRRGRIADRRRRQTLTSAVICVTSASGASGGRFRGRSLRGIGSRRSRGEDTPDGGRLLLRGRGLLKAAGRFGLRYGGRGLGLLGESVALDGGAGRGVGAVGDGGSGGAGGGGARAGGSARFVGDSWAGVQGRVGDEGVADGLARLHATVWIPAQAARDEVHEGIVVCLQRLG